MTMDIPSPAQHGRLILRQSPIPKTPRMDPELLPVKIPHLKHAMLGKERISMIPPRLPRHQAGKPLLIPEEGTTQGHIPPTLKVPPHHQTILKVWENQPIIE